MIVCTLSISFPLSLYRSIESLSRASAIALVSMVLIIVTIIVRGPAMPDDLKGDPSLRFTIIHPSNIVRSIAVISFAFVCHHNSLLIYGSLKEPSMDRFGKVTHYSTAIAATALVAMSLAGYWSFTDRTLGNVLNNFPADDTMVNIARFCFGMNMCVASRRTGAAKMTKTSSETDHAAYLSIPLTGSRRGRWSSLWRGRSLRHTTLRASMISSGTLS